MLQMLVKPEQCLPLVKRASSHHGGGSALSQGGYGTSPLH